MKQERDNNLLIDLRWDLLKVNDVSSLFSPFLFLFYSFLFFMIYDLHVYLLSLSLSFLFLCNVRLPPDLSLLVFVRTTYFCSYQVRLKTDESLLLLKFCFFYNRISAEKRNSK